MLTNVNKIGYKNYWGKNKTEIKNFINMLVTLKNNLLTVLLTLF